MHSVMGTGRLVAGRYRLQEPIGRGAMGIVWRGRDELLDRAVAVKEVQVTSQASVADAEVIYQRTLREARTAARLSHPSVVTVFDVVEEDGSPWIVMELIEAKSLDRIITEDGPLPPDKAADLGASLISALATAHSAGVLHRDVKPSNVLVGKDGRAVLTDFGIATFAEDLGLTQAGMVVGTPGFTAPERIRGDIATPASDLWSLGATLYAAVEGRGPFDRVGGSTIISAGVAAEDAPRAPSAGPLGPVIDALLSRDPGTRPDAPTAARLLAEAATEARTGPRPLSQDWEAAEAADDAADTEGTPAPKAEQLAAADSGFLDPPDYSRLEMPAGQGSDGSVGSGDVAAAAGATAAVSAADARPGAAGSPAAPSDTGRGIVDPSSGPALWGPVKSQPGSGGAALGQPGGPDGPGADGPGGWGDGGSGSAGDGKTPPRRPWRTSRTWRLSIAAAGIAAFVVAAVVGWNIFQHSGPASALGNSNPPGVTGAEGSTSSHSSHPGSAATHGPSGSNSGNPSSGGTGTHSAGPGGSPRGSGKPSTGTSSGGGTGPSASPSGSPTPSTSPSSTPTATPSPTPSPTPTLPSGWKWHKFSAAEMGTVAGFKIGMPDAWTQSVVAPVAHLTQSARNFHLAVDLNYWLYTKPLREAQYLETLAAASHKKQDFHVLVLEATNFTSLGGWRSSAAAELKYTWKAATGTAWTEIVYLTTLPTTAGAQSYEWALWAPSSTYSAAYGVLHQAMPTFRPLPGPV